MGKYIERFFFAHMAVMLLNWGMVWISLVNWLFRVVPEWFMGLSLLTVLLPYFLLGLLGGRRWSAVPAQEARRAFFLTFAAMFLLELAMLLFQRYSSFLYYTLDMQGVLFAGYLAQLADWSGYGWYSRWGEGVLLLAGGASMRILFHLGWRLGKRRGKNRTEQY